MPFFQSRRAKRLDARARELIDVGLYDEALAIVSKLRAMGHPAAYEIEARALSGLGKHEDAIRVLREGLAITPGDWRNWLLLGACLNQLGRFDDAARAHDRAEECEGCDKEVVAVNREILEMWRLDPMTAEQALDRIRRS